MRSYDSSSTVEAVAIERSGRQSRYAPREKIGVIEAENYPLLGQLVALRFIEWVQKNPGGVIALPSGKTPEPFISWTRHILTSWHTDEVQKLLAEYRLNGSHVPDMKSLIFVQMDEFYPIDASQQNSFHYYVNEFYIKGFGLDPAKALLIDTTRLGLPDGYAMSRLFPDNIVDLSLRVRHAKSDSEKLQRETIFRVDAFCAEYEKRIRGLGGIGFFLGGIGPDGHIAFNIRGSSPFSTTRLTDTNYETQAAAAGDLGGIEIARNRLVITIGLSTITWNPAVTAIIMAAGTAKAAVVRRAIEEDRCLDNPASVLHDLPASRFFLTKTISDTLTIRRQAIFEQCPALTSEQDDDIVISLSLSLQKPLHELTEKDFQADPLAASLLKKTSDGPAKPAAARDRLIAKIEKGLAHISNTVFLHTEPHQDDIMLGYLSCLYHLVRDPTNRHSFANLTSGFTSVSNHYCLSIARALKTHLGNDRFLRLLQEGYFDDDVPLKRMEDVYLYLDGSASGSREKKSQAEARRLLRNIIAVYGTTDPAQIAAQVDRLERYLTTRYPGAKDPPDIQKLKGMLREWEAELLWARFGIEAHDIHALRLGFYAGDIFTAEPVVERDVLPIVTLLREVKPDIVSVAFDPEGNGPDTHYKALQAMAEAIKLYVEESGNTSLRIWGYRNVWHRFRPAEANLMVPVSLNTLSLMHGAFLDCFGSQRAASFPSFEHDGPFSELAQKIQVDNYAMLTTCLGQDFFYKNSHPRLRAARGMVFLRDMALDEFHETVRNLKKATEAI
ncbi:MAG: hypothetical protein JW768_01945 [Chitinispirillaceae bacterium]|nr:hypothetical protein [Chitinispirillaceae bacterium]